MKKFILICLFYFAHSSFSYASCLAESTTGKCDDVKSIPVDTASENTEAALKKMKDDMKSKIEGSILPNLGDSMSWGNGTLTRTKKGELRYVTTVPVYFATTINATTDLIKLAKDSPSVNDQFISDYGFIQNSSSSSSNSISHEVKSNSESSTSVPSNKTAAKGSGNLDYICKAKDSAMMMLVKAAENYKNKTITKDQLIEVAVSVAKMGKFNNNVAEEINEKGFDLPAPIAIETKNSTRPITTCWVKNACVPYVPCALENVSSSNSVNVSK